MTRRYSTVNRPRRTAYATRRRKRGGGRARRAEPTGANPKSSPDAFGVGIPGDGRPRGRRWLYRWGPHHDLRPRRADAPARSRWCAARAGPIDVPAVHQPSSRLSSTSAPPLGGTPPRSGTEPRSAPRRSSSIITPAPPTRSWDRRVRFSSVAATLPIIWNSSAIVEPLGPNRVDQPNTCAQVSQAASMP
jgi:hypothetical protein